MLLCTVVGICERGHSNLQIDKKWVLFFLQVLAAAAAAVAAAAAAAQGIEA